MAIHTSEPNQRLAMAHPGILGTPAILRISPSYLVSRRKRALDIMVGLIGVLLFIIVTPIVAILIKSTSKGPVFYRQQRVGLNGEFFELLKFRTMTADAEKNGAAVWATPDDPRITTVGRMLRRVYIDEFPQWWNVLRGQMSVVGPRPERPELAKEILGVVPNFNDRLLAKPGMTGLAQVHYKYTNTANEARNKLRHDLIYINAATFRLDLQLIVRTFARVWLFRGT